MGLLAEIYLSRDDEAVRYDTAPAEFADRALYTGLTPLELSTLWALIQGVEWEVDSLDEFPCLLQIDGGERLIHRLPAKMMTELAALSPERVEALLPAWAATEELRCSPEDVRHVVDGLVRLARKAGETGQSVHLWNCV